MSLPTQDQMSPEQKAIRKIELEQLNQECDRRAGRVTAIGQAWGTEKNLSKEIVAVLDSLESKPRPTESTLHKPESPEMKARQDQFDNIVKNRPSPHYKTGPISAEERLIAWHRHLGTPSHIVDAELKQLREGKA